MREAARWTTLIVAMAVTTLPIWAIPQSAAGASVWSAVHATTIDTATIDSSTVTTPEPVTPETTEPESTTATTEPGDAPETSTDDVLVGAGDPDGDIDSATAAIAIVGFVALLVLASWWMVRRSDPDTEPMPPRPPSDLI